MGGRSPASFAAPRLRRYRDKSGFLGGRADTAHRDACAVHAGAAPAGAAPVAAPARRRWSNLRSLAGTSVATEQGSRAASAGTAPDGTSATAEAVPRRWSLAGSAAGTSSDGTRQGFRKRTDLLDLGRDRLGRCAASNAERGRRQRLFARPVRSRRRHLWSRVGLRRLPHDDGRSVAGSRARGGCSRLFVRPLLAAGGPVWRGGKSRSVATSSPPEPTGSSCSRRGR